MKRRTSTSSSSITIAATSITNIPVTTSMAGTIMASASIFAPRAATTAPGGAFATPASSSQEGDDDVYIIDPPPLVTSVSQFYNDDETLRAPNPDLETTALWRSQVLLPFQVSNVTYSFLGPISSLEQIELISSCFPSPPNTFL
ncbi:hypothetical protein Ahy_B06g085378 [Arachis hypogaea]|uniref:Uncharacterized protein n=1 Tax=Arachis hypogaea TaxID=3818 RepID=A0A444YUE4_ARAHY|nr:hypothetical protein Ahy_B06g085378 [Arachis hypogaea]